MAAKGISPARAIQTRGFANSGAAGIVLAISLVLTLISMRYRGKRFCSIIISGIIYNALTGLRNPI
jgi:hypothetical protein